MTAGLIDDADTWDTFVNESVSGRLFHKWDFMKITEKHTGFTFLPYGIFRGNELICIFPLFKKQIHGLTILLSPPPLQSVIPYLGFIMGQSYDAAKQSKKESMLRSVAEDLESEIAALAPNYLALTQVPGFIDIRQFLREGYEARIHFSYVIDLEPPLAEIWNGLLIQPPHQTAESREERLPLREEHRRLGLLLHRRGTVQRPGHEHPDDQPGLL
ncbi:hypothetical protein [Methanoculleus sp. 10]|uniref:hypothetical protein n=1 Tax=Methanoculleus sp. 10 TaxID=430615 RepID=UPI0025EE2B26|nr:hypothetical protein [Methanoculleus sp. 10]